MSGDSLSIKLRAKVETMFPPEQVAAVPALLETQCGADLPLIGAQDPVGVERVRWAALRMSGGSLERLQAAIESANRDWRDALVAGGFATSVRAHLWLESDETR
jgi:hypothetical protein